MLVVACRRLITTARPRTFSALTSSPITTRTPSTAFRLPPLRTMSTSTITEPQKFEWLIILPDQANALPRRMEVRQQHLDNLKTYPDDFWLWGGGFLADTPKEGEPMQMLGSAMLAWAASREEVLEKLKGDVYTRNEVWDWDKVQIYPFKSAIRKPL